MDANESQKIDKFLAGLSPDGLRYAYGACDAMMEGEGKEEGDMSPDMEESDAESYGSEPSDMPEESSAPAPKKKKKKGEEDDMIDFSTL